MGDGNRHEFHTFGSLVLIGPAVQPCSSVEHLIQVVDLLEPTVSVCWYVEYESRA